MSAGIIASHSVAVAASYSAAVLADSPLGYWRLGEASGATSADSSGNARTATWAGTGAPTFGVTGLVSGADTAITLSGATSGPHATIANAFPTPAFSSGLSIEAFIKSNGTGVRTIFARDNVATTDQAYTFEMLFGNLAFRLNTTAGDQESASSVIVNDNAVHHVVGTFNGSEMRVYVDGTDVSNGGPTTGLGGGAYRANATGPAIGAKRRLTTERFLGTLDEVAVYGAALSAARVAAHYAAR